jgi:hypothetical protein
MTDLVSARLHLKHPDLARAIFSASPDDVRRVVTAAARVALRNARLDRALHDTVLAAIEGLRALAPDARAELVRVQERCEARYFEGLSACGPHDHLAQVDPQAKQSFFCARGADAVLRALGDLDAAAATDVVYETLASDPNEAMIVEDLWKAIGPRRSSRPPE